MDEPETEAGERPERPEVDEPEPEPEPGVEVVVPFGRPEPPTVEPAASSPAPEEQELEAPEDAGSSTEPESLPRALGVGSPEKPDRLSIEADRAVGRFMTGGLALGLLIVFLFVSIGQNLGPLGIVVGLFLWGLIVGLTFLFCERWPVLQWERTYYRVDDGGIEIESGVVWRSVVNVPRSRVQHTDVLEGPIARRFGLATLVIHTAGRTTSTVSLAGLERTIALRIRDVLTVDERRV